MSTLTVFADMNPVPRVLIDVPVSEFPAGSVTVSLQSTCGGRTIDVRGGQRFSAASPMIVLDPEPGFMVPTSYTVVGRDASGEIVGSWPLGSATVEFNGVVIQQPLDPRLSVVVERMPETAQAITRPSPFQKVYPQGQVLPGLVGLGPRRGIESLEWELLTASQADADRLQETLGTYERRQLPVWLIRTPPDQRIPRRYFCAVDSLVELDTFRLAGTGEQHFRAVTTEVRPPAAGISATVLTHSDMRVFFSTHTQVKAKYATHSDVKRDSSLVGAANA